MRNKKVCILTTVHPALDTRIFHKEAKTLVKNGYDVTLIAQHSKNETVDGIKINALPKPKNRIFRILFLTKKAYKIALNEKANVYHFHDPELLLWMPKLKKKTGAKVIYDVHEDYPKQILSKYWIPKLLRKSISKIFDFYERKVVKDFDFITVGESVKERLEKNNPNVEVIKNFPDLDKFRNLTKEPKNSKIFNLIYVGGITKERGIIQLVQAMDYLPEYVRPILIGKFSPPELEKEVKDLESFKKVDYLGWVPFDKIPSYLVQADVGIICFLSEPNHIDSNPNKLFEYMAAGLPVIASNFPLWKEIIEGNKCGICVNPLDPKEIAKAVEYLIEHPEEAKKMGENGRKAVLEKYNWENESKKLSKIYEKLRKK